MSAPPKFIQCFNGSGFSRLVIEYLWANRPSGTVLEPWKIRATVIKTLMPRREELEQEAKLWDEAFRDKPKPGMIQ